MAGRNRESRVCCLTIGNESVPEIILNNTINLFLKTAISISVISNHNRFRVLFHKIASVYFICKKYSYILALKMASPGNRHCAIMGSAHFRSLWVELDASQSVRGVGQVYVKHSAVVEREAMSAVHHNTRVPHAGPHTQPTHTHTRTDTSHTYAHTHRQTDTCRQTHTQTDMSHTYTQTDGHVSHTHTDGRTHADRRTHRRTCLTHTHSWYHTWFNSTFSTN